MERIELRRLDVHELQGLLDLRHAPNAFPSDLAETLLRYAGGRSWGLADAVSRLEIEGALAEDERGIWQVDDVQVAKLLGRGLYNPVSHIASRHPDYARAFEDFLLDAALCGDLVPVNLLLDLQAPDVDVKDALADLVEEELVTGLEIFADLQYGHPGFPASVNVYRFREPIIRLAILERFSRKERLAGAARVAPSLRRGLPVRTRDVAWLFVTLSEHLGEAERDEMLRDLAWWVGTEEADYLREGLVEALAEGKLKPEALWGAVEGTEGRWPPYRRLALLDAYGTGLRDEEDKPLGVPMERLGRFHRLRANLLHDLGLYEEALGHAELAKKIDKAQSGKQSVPYLLDAALVGDLLRHLGDFAPAKEVLQEALALADKLLGQDHHNTLTTKNHLAMVLEAQGDLSRAREKYEEVLKARILLLGPEDYDTLATKQSLAGVLQAQSELSRSREMFEEVLEARIRILGPEHSRTKETGEALRKLAERRTSNSGEDS